MKKVQIGDLFDRFFIRTSRHLGVEKVYLDTGKITHVFPGSARIDFPRLKMFVTIFLKESGSFNRSRQTLKGYYIQPAGESELSPSWATDKKINSR